MIAMFANLALVHPGVHAHPHGESWLDTLAIGPGAALVIAAVAVALGYAVARRRHQE